MDITLTITLAPEVKALIESLVKAVAPAAKEPVTQSRKKQTPEVTEHPAAVVIEPVEKEAEPEIQKISAPISIEKVRAAVQVKAQAGKKDAIKSLLTEFNAENVTSLTSDQYGDFLLKVNAL